MNDDICCFHLILTLHLGRRIEVDATHWMRLGCWLRLGIFNAKCLCLNADNHTAEPRPPPQAHLVQERRQQVGAARRAVALRLPLKQFRQHLRHYCVALSQARATLVRLSGHWGVGVSLCDVQGISTRCVSRWVHERTESRLCYLNCAFDQPMLSV